MKLFSEKLTKLKLIMLFLFGIIEIISFIIFFILYKPIFLKILDQMKESSLVKTVSISKNYNEIIRLLFIKYTQDLKFIAKHVSLLSNDEINTESDYYQNLINNEEKNILNANLEELKEYFPEYYDNSQKKFLYLENYINNYIDNKTNQMNILNELMNNEQHPELNSISFYKIEGSVSDIENGSKKEIYIKYLISILKTVYINKLITKGREFDINHIILLSENELYIYPPDTLENILIYKFKYFCYRYDNIPECIFDNMNFLMFIKSYNYEGEDYIFPIFPFPYLNENIYYDMECLSIPFEEPLVYFDYAFSPKICMELNMSKVLSEGFFESKESVHFLYFSTLAEDIIIIYNDRLELFSDIRKVFNDPKYKKYYYKHENNEEIIYFYFFQYLYLELFKEPSLLKNNNITLDYIFEEYEVIRNKIIQELYYNLDVSKADYFTLNFNKTTCKSDIYFNKKKCLKDNFFAVVYPFYNNYNIMDANYIENPKKQIKHDLFHSMIILDNNYDYFGWKKDKIVIIIIIKLFLFFLISSICLYFFYLIFIKLFLKIKYNPIKKILNIIKKGSFFEINDKNEIFTKTEEIVIKPNNKEMLEINNLFDYLLKILIFKINLEEIENNTNNIVSLNNIDFLSKYIDIIKDLDNKEISIMLSFIISYIYFKKGLFKQSENIYNILIKEINLYQNKISNKTDIINSNFKDKLSRCSKVSYLNEYSLTNELNENILKIIKIKLLLQKIYYLNGLVIFNRQKAKENNIKKNNKFISQKIYEQAIKYFIESKNLSKLFGTNIIRQIFSLIMISKCYIELKNYKESMININEALLLFSDLQKAFKDKSYFNHKIIVFTENYIFQSIMLSMAQITFNFDKYSQSCWILMKMIETSPFVFNNIHFQACFLLYNSMIKIENSYNIPLRQIDKYKKRINKMFSRISIRIFNYDKKINSDSLSNIKNINFASIHSEAYTYVNNANISFNNVNIKNNSKNLKINKDMYTSRLSLSISSLYNLSKNRHKNISLCISEKLIQGINRDELKDVIIKFFKKCFLNEENEFSFIQFSYNGKKTLTIKSNS